MFNLLLNSLKSFFLFFIEPESVEMGAAEPWQLMFQDPATPIMEGIIGFHNDLMVFIIAIVVFVLWMLMRSVILFDEGISKNTEVNSVNNNIVLDNLSRDRISSIQTYSKGINHNTFIEIVWTLVPAFILMIIAIPSFALLYSMEEFIEPTLTVKCTGHQWYWCYEYSNCKKSEIAEHIDGVKFESYMIPTEDLEEGNLRLLEVDNQLYLPTKTHIQVTVTAADVIHCWTVPSLGVKIDACPGRLNQTTMFIKREGVFYGQCSELCGVNHGFMPIVVNAVSMYDFMLKQYINSLCNILDDDPELEDFEL
jgi:cytochrome c oxidase subunit 2